jgi:exosortase A-associated hydrolase 1
VTAVIDTAMTFQCKGASLVGVYAAPSSPAAEGVLVIVGGPQYRAGSHRQFTLLGRALARGGFATMRFDYRGMGDSDGSRRSFEDITEDIAAAIDAFLRACPGLRRVVLWGLCDAAAAALIYMARTNDARVAGLVLLNPWVRSDTTLAQARIRHYYLKRLFSAESWRKLIVGRLDLRGAFGGMAGDVRTALASGEDAVKAGGSFQTAMEEGLRASSVPTLLVLSGRDLTAREFEEHVRASGRWRELLDRPSLERCRIVDADHTFSSAAWRAEIEQATLGWLRRRVAEPRQ